MTGKSIETQSRQVAVRGLGGVGIDSSCPRDTYRFSFGSDKNILGIEREDMNVLNATDLYTKWFVLCYVSFI